VTGATPPKQAGDIRDRWWWVEHSVWTDRRLTRLEASEPTTVWFGRWVFPAVRDRTVEAALRNVLEPIFENDFAESSYGFRPGRGCREAVGRVEELLSQGCVWCVDCDLKSYPSLPLSVMASRSMRARS
jgi:hypothetical protein